MSHSKTGVLLLNLGTPKSPEKKAVKAFLKEFLDDHRVVDLPYLARKILLHGVILPFRPKNTAKAYQAIWDPLKGSPLLFHSQDLAETLRDNLGDDFWVEVGMRYGEPDISSALDNMIAANCHQMIILPLFPQYSSAASGSAIQKTLECLKNRWNIPSIKIQHQFYADPEYITAQSEIIAPYLEKVKPDAMVLSYHSLPERHLKKSNGHFCYRTQCLKTSHLLAQKLNLTEKNYRVAFQSKIGRTKWIGPDVQTVFSDLISQNCKNILVACPSFVADCLETLEEIGIRGLEQWKAMGGKEFTLVPCLNADPLWVKAVGRWVRRLSMSTSFVF
ncbi:MAG: ferrochelatase [Candidatus Berkiellales bacterium]